MLGGNGYECQRCPECGSLMWNGECKNVNCKYHWNTMNEDESEQDLEM